MDKSPNPEAVHNLIDVDASSPEPEAMEEEVEEDDYNHAQVLKEAPMIHDEDHLDTVHVQNDDSARSWPHDNYPKSKT